MFDITITYKGCMISVQALDQAKVKKVEENPESEDDDININVGDDICSLEKQLEQDQTEMDQIRDEINEDIKNLSSLAKENDNTVEAECENE